MGIYSCMMSCGCHPAFRTDKHSMFFVGFFGAALRAAEKNAAQCRMAMGGGYPSMLAGRGSLAPPRPHPIPFSLSESLIGTQNVLITLSRAPRRPMVQPMEEEITQNHGEGRAVEIHHVRGHVVDVARAVVVHGNLGRLPRQFHHQGIV